jgi:peptidoglycan hydrolase CwlO-like protein
LRSYESSINELTKTNKQISDEIENLKRDLELTIQQKDKLEKEIQDLTNDLEAQQSQI